VANAHQITPPKINALMTGKRNRDRSGEEFIQKHHTPRVGKMEVNSLKGSDPPASLYPT
jgi:hypothetical protein